MNKKYEVIIFDLDGTLLDTSRGIYNSVRYAEEAMGFHPISNEQLKEFVGPPPTTMYMKMYGVNEKIAMVATAKHREYGRKKAIYEADIYPGMKDVLTFLKQQGYKLAVATLKSQSIAEVVLENYDLSVYFDIVIGMDDGETLTKCKTIELVCEKLGVNQDILMIGDSQYDYIGAQEAGVDFLGVLYGFGFDLENSYPFPTVMEPELINAFLDGNIKNGKFLKEYDI